MYGFVVKYNNTKFYTYNRSLAVKMAQKHQGELKKVSDKEVKKALDRTIDKMV